MPRPRTHPAECTHCGDTITYYRDDEGLWAECACDSGYVELTH